MESNGMPGRMFGNLGSSAGMIGLEPSLQQPSSQQNAPHHRQQTHPPPPSQQTTTTQMIGFSTGYNTTPTADQSPQTHLSMKQNYQNHPFFAAPHQQQPKPAGSDEDEHEHGSANDGDPFDGKRKIVSPWQRMKWTDTMVKLLIMAVYYIGDEAGGGSSSEQPSAGDKKSKSGGSGTAAAQKKGKWKSVSWAMMEKGYSVSPQQCEDKFNDLNKRYKRVNDILGKGTACKVVENQGLLDGMDLSPKMKEEVRKLLNSKHLYFREMCAYHNSCGHGGGALQSSESAVEQQQHHQQLQNQLCNSHPMMMTPPSSMNMRGNFAEESMFLKGGEHEIDEDEDEEDDDEEEYDHDDHGHVSGQDCSRKRGRGESNSGGIAAAAGFLSGGGGGSGSPSPPMMCTQLSGEIMGVLGDGNKTAWDKKHWMMVKLLQVEEQGVKYQYEAFEIEKQRLKWVRFSSKKEREMEKMKIDNERRRLENQRMLLLLKQKELEMLNHQRPSPTSNPSPMSN